MGRLASPEGEAAFHTEGHPQACRQVRESGRGQGVGLAGAVGRWCRMPPAAEGSLGRPPAGKARRAWHS